MGLGPTGPARRRQSTADGPGAGDARASRPRPADLAGVSVRGRVSASEDDMHPYLVEGIGKDRPVGLIENSVTFLLLREMCAISRRSPTAPQTCFRTFSEKTKYIFQKANFINTIFIKPGRGIKP